MSEAQPVTASEPPPDFKSDGKKLARFARYELIGELASGGMGSVYLARHAGEAGFQRLYAVKVMHSHLARDEDFVKMLLDEARLASRLHHPNVVPILDVGFEGGRHFLAMDYVEGCTLAQLARRLSKRREPALFIPLVIDALEGLHAAHTLTGDDDEPLHLVHRDVSAQNIMVGVDGSARVIDFGIAKAEARITSTKPGVMKGKVAYMAPEQLVNEIEVDARADVFAAGAVLWGLLTGKSLFAGDSDTVTLNNLLTKDVPPPSTTGLHPPKCFDGIVLKALQRKREDRYPSAAAMAEALRHAAQKNGLLVPRSKIAEAVKKSFKKEFAARRAAIRESGRSTAISFEDADSVDILELPGIASSDGDATSGVTPLSGASAHTGPTEAAPMELPPAPAPAGRGKLVAGVAVVALIGLLAWVVAAGDSDSAASETGAEHAQVAAPPTAVTPAETPAAQPVEEPADPDEPAEARDPASAAEAKPPSQKAPTAGPRPRGRPPATAKKQAPPAPPPPPPPRSAPTTKVEQNPYL